MVFHFQFLEQITMVNFKVGGEEKNWIDVDERWLCSQIAGRRRDHLPDCVQVRIEDDEVDLFLTTPGCSSGVGGSRPLRGREERIIELWRKLHLNQAGFSCGNVHAFLVQLQRIL